MKAFGSTGNASSRALLTQNWLHHAEELIGNKKSTPLRQLPQFTTRHRVLFPDDTFVQVWNVVITVLMLYTATVTPYRIALVDSDSYGWEVLDVVIDSLFALDVCVNCVLCYYDQDSVLVTANRLIFMRYLRTWMLLDILACMPFQRLIESSSNYNNMIKLVRLPRLYKLIKLAKLIRISKIIKNRNRIMFYVSSVLRIGLSCERLLWFVLWLLLILHLFSCTWVFIGKLNEIDGNTWIMVKGYQGLEYWDLYMVGVYFSVTTLATVGYGDITPCNSSERAVCSLMMLIGIFVYSIIIGSLTNILISLDRRRAALNSKINVLNELSGKYNFSKLFYHKLTQALEYENMNSTKELEDLINGLPSNLKTQLLIAIYYKMIEHNAFFDGRTEHFVAWVAPQLSPCRIVEDEYVYKELDPALEMYFVIRGEVEYVLTSVVDQPAYHVVKANYYFGEEDLLFSDMKLHHFTVKTSVNCEFLTLSRDYFEDLLRTFETDGVEIVSMTEQRRIRILAHKSDAEVTARNKAEVTRHESGPKRPKVIFSGNAHEDKEGETLVSEETPHGNHNEIRRFASIDFLQRSDTMMSIQRKRTLVRQYTLREKEKVRGREVREIKNRMDRMEIMMESVESKLQTICSTLGGESPSPAPAKHQPTLPELPPYLATIPERGSTELDEHNT